MGEMRGPGCGIHTPPVHCGRSPEVEWTTKNAKNGEKKPNHELHRRNYSFQHTSSAIAAIATTGSPFPNAKFATHKSMNNPRGISTAITPTAGGLNVPDLQLAAAADDRHVPRPGWCEAGYRHVVASGALEHSPRALLIAREVLHTRYQNRRT